ncbi:hypothetical protein [Nodosilinea sp. E11]|uniref:hypothetical protein n=1 Tax=Nodosilinea sp. E11 TaxID=3037479 RepID=UPI0029348F88|nr:hypothetical protein [Nodosilinea sp. E11]WOD37397.1 hypothetical protein RRF56_02670 [Nodosilinea sp. E11]
MAEAEEASNLPVPTPTVGDKLSIVPVLVEDFQISDGSDQMSQTSAVDSVGGIGWENVQFLRLKAIKFFVRRPIPTSKP